MVRWVGYRAPPGALPSPLRPSRPRRPLRGLRGGAGPVWRAAAPHAINGVGPPEPKPVLRSVPSLALAHCTGKNKAKQAPVAALLFAGAKLSAQGLDKCEHLCYIGMAGPVPGAFALHPLRASMGRQTPLVFLAKGVFLCFTCPEVPQPFRQSRNRQTDKNPLHGKGFSSVFIP